MKHNEENNTNRPLIFITNDDGVDAKGIRSLVAILSGRGRVVVVAPDGPQSGQSSSITVDHPLRIRRHSDYEEAEIYSVNGSPVDCVKLGLHAVVGVRPDIIVSGINHGSNAGNSVIYSGTMGAAMEGCLAGIPSVGFSLLDYSRDADFSHMSDLISGVVDKVLEHGLPDGVCLNVNAPAGSFSGVKVVRAARGFWTEEYVAYTDPMGRPFYLLSGHFHNAEPDATDTDEYWLHRGEATIVPVQVDQSAPQPVIEAVRTLIMRNFI